MKFSICLFLSFFALTHSFAQGCSDAGFCTAGAMQGGVKADTVSGKNTLAVSLTYGYGEKGTNIITPQFEASFSVWRGTQLEVRLPVNIASGKLGHYTGIGDLITTATHPLGKRSYGIGWSGTVGARISTGGADASDKGMPLPMPYQSNLGTADVIIGCNATVGKYFTFAAGWQQPIIHYNNNQYQPSILYPDEGDDANYFAARKLRRRGDVLLRAEGHFKWRRFALSGGPLLIYHLGKDAITEPDGTEVKLKGSVGATLNLAGAITYTTTRFKYDLLLGTPLIVRDYRPDGLTRAAVITGRVTVLSW